MTDLHDALEVMVPKLDEFYGCPEASIELADLLAEHPPPVLPDGAMAVGDEAWWECQNDGRWKVCVSGKTWTRAAYTDDQLREMGVSAPELAPEITVGCIVRTPNTWVGSVEWSTHGWSGLWSERGDYLGSWPTADLTYVAPDREPYGWPPIQEER